MDPQQQQQEQIRAAWDRVAPGFDAHTTPLTMPLAERALQAVKIGKGTMMLDVAAGSGALTIPAARAGAKVVATDLSPVMVERLADRVRAMGLNNVEPAVMDGQRLDLDEDSFDVAASQNGVTLFPDMARGLHEMTRVTKPGGQVLVVTFGPLPRTEFVSTFFQAVKMAAPDAPAASMGQPPLPFQAADPQVLRARMEDAGLRDVRVEAVDWAVPFESVDSYWDAVMASNPIAMQVLGQLPEQQRADVKKALGRMFAERGANGPVVMHNQVNIAVGTK